jgi:hypothetical protein
VENGNNDMHMQRLDIILRVEINETWNVQWNIQSVQYSTNLPYSTEESVVKKVSV